MELDAATLTLAVLGIAAFFFATEIIPLAVTAMGAAIALGFLGVLTPAEVFSGLSNSTVVLFAGMFVIGAAMFQTGLAQKIGVEVVKKSGTDEKKLMIALMVITIILSSVSSNTATVACLIPVVMQICAAARLPVAPQLMALAVDDGPGVAVGPQSLQKLHEFAFAPSGHGSQNLEPGALRQLQKGVHDLLGGLGGNGQAADGTMGHAHPGEEETEIIVDLGDGPHG